MNISISTGDFGSPSVSPCCGMPLKRLFASGAPGSAFAELWLPVAGRSCMSLELTIPPPPPPPLPLLRTTPSTMAITATRTTPPAIASARGDAWRGRTPPTPFERTGGGVLGAIAASRRCCLALFPLGMRGKGSRRLGFLGLPGAREDQESDEKKEPRQREGRDRDVPELVDPLDVAAPRLADRARLGLGDHVVLDQEVVDRGAGADDRQRQEVARRAVVAASRDQQREDRERVHEHPLEPAELAGREVRDLREEEAAPGRDRSDDEGSPQLVAPKQVADRVERRPDAEEREQAHEEPQRDENLADDAEDRKG